MKLLNKGQAFEDRFRGGFVWAVVLTGSTGLSAIFMFLVHVVAVRFLRTEQYGEFASAIALVGIVGVAASSVQAATVKKVKEPDQPSNDYWSHKIELLLLGTFSLSLGIIAHFLIGVSVSTASLLALWVPAAIMIARANGEIQGREIQSILHGATAVIASATLLLSAVLLFIWNDVESLLIARLFVTLVFAIFLLRATETPIKSSLRFVNTKLIHATVLVSSMWFAANLDVLLSRSALGDVENGEIAIAAMLVNSVLLIPGLIAAVVYPKAIELRKNKELELKLLAKAVLLSGVVQLILAIVLTIMGKLLVTWLTGSGHSTAISVVFPLSLAYIPLGISIVVSQFVLALGKLRHSLFFMFLVVISSAMLLTINSSAKNFVYALLLFSWVLAAVLIAISVHQIARIRNEN